MAGSGSGLARGGSRRRWSWPRQGMLATAGVGAAAMPPGVDAADTPADPPPVQRPPSSSILDRRSHASGSTRGVLAGDSVAASWPGRRHAVPPAPKSSAPSWRKGAAGGCPAACLPRRAAEGRARLSDVAPTAAPHCCTPHLHAEATPASRARALAEARSARRARRVATPSRRRAWADSLVK